MSYFFPDPNELSRHEIFRGVRIMTCAGDQMMISDVSLEPHSVVEEHSHPHEQMGLLLSGKVVFHIGDEQRTLEPGDMWRIPGNVRHKVICLDEPARAIDIFCPVREDYR